MTGFRNALLGAAGTGAAGGGYSVDNSIVLDDGSSQYLTWTPAGAGSSDKIGTISVWVKRGNITEGNIFSSGASGSDYNTLTFKSDHKLQFSEDTNNFTFTTTQVFRDPHSWYHIVVAFDTTQSTSSNRVKFYVNGGQITSFDTETYPAQNFSMNYGAAKEHNLGRLAGVGGSLLDGYIAEAVYIDGSQLDATSFGEYDTNGVWRPIDVSGLTFGTNGFYLPFTDSTNLGLFNTIQSTPSSSQNSNWRFAEVKFYEGSYSQITNATAEGDMTSNGGLAGAFDGTDSQSFTACAATNATIFGKIGQDWGAGNSKTVTKVETISPNNATYDGNNTIPGGQVCIEVFGSNTAHNTDGVLLGRHEFIQSGTASNLDTQTITNLNTTTAYRHHWIEISQFGRAGFRTSGSPTQSSDTPTNNSATLTTIDGSGATFSNGNLVVGSNTTNSYKGGTGCIGLAPGSGSWYVEALCTGATGSNKEYVFGAATNDTNKSVAGYFPGSATYSNDDEHGYYSGSGGIVYNGSSSTGSVGIYGDGDTVALRFDMDVTTPTCKFYVNDTLKHTANLTVGKTYYPHFNTQDLNLTFTVNFGATPFTYTLPTGHLAINTTNLYTNAAPAIEDGTAYFQATTYTGTGSAREVNQSGNTTFQPDWVWVKERGGANEHRLIDAVRGATETLYLGGAMGTAGEATESTGVTSFDSDGFSVGTGGGYNNLNDTYVGWQWKGDGTSGSSNTDGSITTTVNANDTAGFSIVKWMGTGANGTVGHGLSAAPDLIMGRNYEDSGNRWSVYHSKNTSAPETDYLVLNTTAATTDDNTVWNDTAPTSTVFSVGTTGHINQVSRPSFVYCFRAIPGYSAFGSYSGSGGSTLVLLDFKPALVITKRTDSSTNGGWVIWDNQRDTYNVMDRELLANSVNAEDVDFSAATLDFLSNGFKFRDSGPDTSGGTYIYAAFAEHPFAGTTPATAR